jgi:hypothetical protein
MRWVLLLITLLPAASAAQTAPQNVEVDPVTCWWRTETTAVRVGQPFSVVLTCSILEADATRAVVDRSRLGPAAVQFPPYEVLGGSQGPDYVTAGRRFIQYGYSLRLISEDAFGVDVPIPGLDVSYRIESRVEQDAAVQGREQSYELPPIPMRVMSLVPDTARGIRESSAPTFDTIAAREFRARMFRLIALILFGVAALTIAVALVRWIRQSRSQTVRVARPLLTNRAVLAGVRRELQAVHQQTRGGWSAETVARALAAARVVASYLRGRAIVQRAARQAGGDGELVITGGSVVRRRVAVSGATTGSDGALSDSTSTDVDDALNRLTRARYGRNSELDGSALDEALDDVQRAAGRVAARHTRAAEVFHALRESLRGWRPRAWAR